MEVHMAVNMGSIDRILRIVVGVALIAWALGLIPGMAPSVGGWVGLVPLGTDLIGNCPAYSIFGISTCGRN